MRLKKNKNISLIVPLPLGALVGTYYSFNHQWGKAVLAISLSVLLSLIAMAVRFIKRVKSHSNKRLDQSAERLAEWIITNLEYFTIKQWRNLTSSFKRSYYSQSKIKYYQYRTQGLRTRGPYQLEMSKVFIPLRLVPKSLGRITPEMIREQNITGGLSIWNFLAAKAPDVKYKHIAIIGAPGSGKTTLLEHLVLAYAQNAQRSQNKKAPKLIPVLIHIREVKNQILVSPAPTLSQLIEGQSYINKLSPPPNWFEDKLRGGKGLVMIDGLDEVADVAQRQEISQWINRQLEDYHSSFFILTSRPFGFDSELIIPNIILEAQPFDLSEMKLFVSRWYLQTEIKEQMRKEDAELRESAQLKADDLVSRILNSPPLAAMAINPLLLTMIATVHKYRDTLPEHRVKLYAEICDALLGRREEAKKIHDPMSAEQKQLVLQVLAYALTKMGTLEFTLNEGTLLIKDILANVTNASISSADFLNKVENVSGLIVEKGPQIYEFAHRSFQDFLTAVQIKETHEEFLLIQNVNNNWWAESTRLYAALSDATEVIQAALGSPTVDSLALAADCLAEAKLVSPTVRQQLELTLSLGLESSNPTVARLVADVKLSQRLNKLLRINENTSIDTTYITVAEYQLFINDGLKIGKYYQPDHWNGTSFPIGLASEPITGIRAGDAEDFCSWLTRKHPSLGFSYELPDKALIESFPTTEGQIGCWAKNGGELTIATANTALRDHWRQLLVAVLSNAIRSDISFNPLDNDDLDNLLKHIKKLTDVLEFDHLIELARQFDSDLDLNTVYNFQHFRRDIDEGRAIIRADILNKLRTNILSLGKGLIPSNNLTVSTDYAFDRSLFLNENEPRSIAIKFLRFYTLLHLFFWFLRLEDIEKTGRISRFQSREYDSISRAELQDSYLIRIRKFYMTYAYFAMLEARNKGLLSPWEGIRITREKIHGN